MFAESTNTHMSSPTKNRQTAKRSSCSPIKAFHESPQRKVVTSPYGKLCEIIKDKLYWVSDSKAPTNHMNAYFFNIDNDLIYYPFNMDFGPLNLAMVHRYCRELARLLNDANFQNNRVFHYCSN
mmetsp:Transcript_62516/g.86387  ORF Transcript_62516/g.86387 Transcript_62516/m.86387 type:complete len:124 (+) Transcript_62516:52-423(+)